MMPLIKTLLLISLTLAASHPCLSWGQDYNEGDTLGPGYLKMLFENIVLNETSLPRENLKVSNFSSRPAELQVPPGTIDYKVISTTTAKQLGRKIIFAAILIDGEEQGRIKLSGDIHLYGDVVCVTRAIQRHTILGRDDLKVIRRNISMLGPGVIDSAELALGKQLKTTLRPGAVIYKRFIKTPELVSRGDLVTILADSGSLRISVPGKVQTAGAKGDIVKVKNLMSRKEIYAVVINSDKVRVEF